MVPKSANGLRGHIIYGIDGAYYFRVYDQDHNFTDYALCHSDLTVTIDDTDAFLYGDGSTARLDHSPTTLGQNEKDIL